MFLPAWCSWQNLLLKPALSQVIAFVHKAIEMALFRSWLKRCFISHKDAQSAQKLAKNDQKDANSSHVACRSSLVLRIAYRTNIKHHSLTIKFDLACWLYVLATLWLTTCGSPLNPSPAGGLRLPAGKHTGNLTDLQT